MAAFDRVQSGIPQMDEHFDNIRLGDNVVWRVDDLDEFKLFMNTKLFARSQIPERDIILNYHTGAISSRILWKRGYFI